MRRRDFLISGVSVGVVAPVLAGVPCPPPSISASGGTTAQTVCEPDAPPASPGTIVSPAYLNSLAPFEVRRLAPSNGKATMQSVTPAEWLNSDPGISKLPGLLSAWCGGIGDSATGRLFILGGGHGDSANNGIYVYDFSGTSAATGFSVMSGSQSSVAAVPAIIQGDPTNYVQFKDGRPSAKHTYDGVVFANNKVYMFGGGSWGAGGFTRDVWKFEGGSWARMPDPPFQSDRPWTTYDPTTRKVLYFNPGGDSYAFFNTNSNTWGSRKSLSNNFASGDAVLVHDTTRHRVLVMGNNYNKLWTVNWSSESISEGTYTPSSILTSSGAVTSLYDPTRDRFWILGGSSGSPGYSNVYEMNPTSFAITAHPLSGDSIPTAASNGTFKRAVLLGNAIGFVSTVDAPAVAIRLP